MGLLDLNQEVAQWKNTSSCAKDIVDRFTGYVNADPELKEHRDFVEKHVYGFGERAFHWLWKLIVDQMPREFSFLEIGVFKGQVPSLVRLLADRTGREAVIVGVTPLSGEGGDHDSYPDTDYAQHITDLHDHFGQFEPLIIKGLSGDPAVQWKVEQLPLFDVIYIDGCHDYEYVVGDILVYGQRLKKGGLLVMDDASCYMAPVWGHCQGIKGVSDAVRAIIETDPCWEYLLAVMHNRVWRKVGRMGNRILDLEPIVRYQWVSGAGGVNEAVKLEGA